MDRNRLVWDCLHSILVNVILQAQNEVLCVLSATGRQSYAPRNPAPHWGELQ